MTAKKRMAWQMMTCRFASAFIGMVTLATALPASGSAQQSDPSVAGPAKSGQNGPARVAPKPVARHGAAQSAKTPGAQGRPWTLQDALPDNSASMRQYDPRPTSPAIGRVPLQSGTVGFETKTQVNPNQTPDGATIRGQDATAARPSSYLGMSLSMPTSD